MNRSRWVILVLVLAAAGGGVALFRPRPIEEFPLAELVPDDAVFYAGFPDLRRFEEIAAKVPGAWTDENRKKFEEAKPHLSGALAFYLDSKGDWVGLARLTRAASAIAGGTVEDGAAIFSSHPAAIERRRARKGALADLPAFRRLGFPCFLNLASFDLEGPLSDVVAAGFRVESADPWRLQGRLAYRADRFRTFLERAVPAPLTAGVADGGPGIQWVSTDPVLRLWDEYLETLTSDERDRVDREIQILQRDLQRDPRDVLGSLGPRWGMALAPSPHPTPAFLAWIEIPDPATAEMLEKMLVRAAGDAERQARARGQSPFLELSKADAGWRLRFPKSPALRMGDAWSPAFRVTPDRIVFTTCEGVFDVPGPARGAAHGELRVRPAAALEMARSSLSFLTDRAFRGEADGISRARQLRESGPLALGALSRKFPDPAEREKFLVTRRAEFAAEALAEISKTDRYRDERARLERLIADWTGRLAGIERIGLTGRFTGEGFDFALDAGR